MAILHLRKLKIVPQGRRLVNQAEFAARPHINTNQRENLIVENIFGSSIEKLERLLARVKLLDIIDFGWKVQDGVPVYFVAGRDPAPPQLSGVINCQ